MGLLDDAPDQEFYGDVGRGLLDVANRGVAGAIGAPVDLLTLALRPLGYSHPSPVGGSEWLGQKMEGIGAISPERRPLAEFLAAIAMPSTSASSAKGVGLLADRAATNLSTNIGGRGFGFYQRGAISPEGYNRFLADLIAGQGSGTYRIGDTTAGQAKRFAEAGLKPPTNNVYMTDNAFNHIMDERLYRNGYSEKDIADFLKQAMAKRSRVDLDVGKSRQHPSLLNEGLLDLEAGKRYDARAPLGLAEDGFGIRSVVPDGLPPRKK